MKNCIYFFVLFLLPLFLFGNSSNETHYPDNEFTFPKYNFKKRDTLPSFIGLTYIPALNWSVNNITNNDGKFLHYHFDQNSQTAIEGNTSIRKIGVRLGLSAQIGNNQIDRIYQYSGYIGIKNIWLYFQSSKVSGTYDWTGPIPFGFFVKRTFNSRFLTIDLRKTMRPPSKSIHDYYMGWYWGIGYTSMGLPLKMTTLTTPGGRENQVFGKPAYDSLFTAQIYSICFGWDLLRQNCLTMGNQGFTPETKPKKFAMYGATQDKIGVGSGIISDYGIAMAEAMNPGKKAVIKKITCIIDYYLSVGFRYTIKTKPAYFVIATGYDLQGSFLFHGAAADTDKDLGFDLNCFYISHGVSVKLFISFTGKNTAKK